jgi:hypothetical protein
MFGTRLIAFVIAVLLAVHVIAPADGWFIALAVLIGLSMLRSLLFAPFRAVAWGVHRSWGRDWRWRWRSRLYGWADEW